jgi:hypothetical protein
MRIIIDIIHFKVGPFANHQWAAPSLTHLQQLMREVVRNPEKARTKGYRARQTMIEYYNPQTVARIVFQRLKEIASKFS